MNREILRTKRAVVDFLQTGVLSSFDKSKLGWGALRASRFRVLARRRFYDGGEGR